MSKVQKAIPGIDMMYANDKRIDPVSARVLTVESLKEMGSTLNMLYGGFIGPKHNVHCYIKMVVRNLKNICENALAN